jgi:hypothetical protein
LAPGALPGIGGSTSGWSGLCRVRRRINHPVGGEAESGWIFVFKKNMKVLSFGPYKKTVVVQNNSNLLLKTFLKTFLHYNYKLKLNEIKACAYLIS